jgi:methylmalonyl-CoA mutase cobalamin-binding subunit
VVAAGAEQDIGPVDPRRLDGDEHLSRVRVRIGHLAQDEHVRGAEIADLCSVHGVSSFVEAVLQV